jgi:hypothetical protein
VEEKEYPCQEADSCSPCPACPCSPGSPSLGLGEVYLLVLFTDLLVIIEAVHAGPLLHLLPTQEKTAAYAGRGRSSVDEPTAASSSASSIAAHLRVRRPPSADVPAWPTRAIAQYAMSDNGWRYDGVDALRTYGNCRDPTCWLELKQRLAGECLCGDMIGECGQPTCRSEAASLRSASCPHASLPPAGPLPKAEVYVLELPVGCSLWDEQAMEGKWVVLGTPRTDGPLRTTASEDHMEIDGAHAGYPCSSFSRLRFRPTEPRFVPACVALRASYDAVGAAREALEVSLDALAAEVAAFETAAFEAVGQPGPALQALINDAARPLTRGIDSRYAAWETPQRRAERFHRTGK